jgi:hypothetical protein
MKEKLQKIGSEATLKTSWGFNIQVEIIDFKQSYGRDRWLVKPLAGNGEAWVENLIIQ